MAGKSESSSGPLKRTSESGLNQTSSSDFILANVETSVLAGMGAPYNPRKISAHDLDALGRSMKTFGVVEPIIVNERTGRVVGGHQRVKAAKREGIKSLPVHYVDLDEVQERQLNVALNRISGEWAEDLLAKLISEISAEGGDLTLTGFDDDEIARYIGTMNEQAAQDTSAQLGGLVYRVIVDATGESHQRELLARFEVEGLICRALIS
jgi:hypothetical protein